MKQLPQPLQQLVQDLELEYTKREKTLSPYPNNVKMDLSKPVPKPYSWLKLLPKTPKH